LRWYRFQGHLTLLFWFHWKDIRMARRKKQQPSKSVRREYPDEFKEEAVQMLLDGHTAPSVVERLGITNVNMLYRWKKEQLARSGPVASSLEARVRELEGELRRVEREREVLKKALAIFGRNE
jgi:transposase